MHKAVEKFVENIKIRYPYYFQNSKILEVGSYYVNGSVRPFFKDCDYIGIDIGNGPGVDIVSRIEHFQSPGLFDVVISTEMMEHSSSWNVDLQKMYDLLKPNGALIVTAAGPGRPEHGTTKSEPWSSPFTNDYYCNITKEMILSVLHPDQFISFYLEYLDTDIQLFGIKK